MVFLLSWPDNFACSYYKTFPCLQFVLFDCFTAKISQITVSLGEIQQTRKVISKTNKMEITGRVAYQPYLHCSRYYWTVHLVVIPPPPPLYLAVSHQHTCAPHAHHYHSAAHLWCFYTTSPRIYITFICSISLKWTLHRRIFSVLKF